MEVGNWSLSDKKRKIQLPKLTEKIAELVGIHIGDGHLGNRPIKNEYLFQITGHSEKDRQYYDTFVVPLINELFNVKPRLNIKKNEKTINIRVYSKGVFTYLNNEFSLPIGKKKCIRIPEQFFNSNELLSACLRGIIDTDFFFSLNEKHNIIGAWFSEKTLVRDINKGLSQLGIKSTTYYDRGYLDKRTNKYYNRHKIHISRKNDILAWYEKIGTHHPHMQIKYNKWKEPIS